MAKLVENQKPSFFNKVMQASEAMLDSYIAKAKATSSVGGFDKKAFIEIDHATNQQYGYKEKRGLVSPEVLKSMGRKDAVIVAIHQTRIGQVSQFAKPQEDQYTPGFTIRARKPADISKEDKIKLADPDLEEEDYNRLLYQLESDKTKRQIQQEEDKEKVQNFILHCGEDGDAEPSHNPYKRMDFETFLKLLVRDRLTYNYAAIELIPRKDYTAIHSFFPTSAKTIRLVSKRSSEQYTKMLDKLIKEEQEFSGEDRNIRYSIEKPFTYVQVIRGKVVAAWTDEEMIFEPANPSVDPEDMGYAPGELEFLIQIVTSHLYAEAHNRNFFTQGIGTKGILHIKGDNVSRSQLEGFKRQWFNQLANTRNAFRPPIIGMADDVKWIPLAQTNREMEFEQWMHYLIRICCAVYQMDPAEINFDISKVQTSTLNESSNEERLKSSKDKGLRPLLSYIEKIINQRILPSWNKELADAYEFRFVGLDAESRQQEIDRLEKETRVWKTVNEARTEKGAEPLDDGDVILNATYTQYKQMKLGMGMEGGEMAAEGEDVEDEADSENIQAQLDEQLDELTDELTRDLDEIEPEKASKKDKEEKTKKSVTIEYHHFDKEEDNDD